MLHVIMFPDTMNSSESFFVANLICLYNYNKISLLYMSSGTETFFLFIYKYISLVC